MEKPCSVTRRGVFAALGLAGGAFVAPRVVLCDAAGLPGSVATVAVQLGESLAAAIARAAARSPCLYLPPGEYLVREPVSIPSGTTLFGAGPRTVLRLADDSGAQAEMVLRDVEQITVRDLVLKGSAVQGANTVETRRAHGIQASGLKRFAFENLDIRDFPGRGVNLWGGSKEGVIRNCRVTRSGDRGIVLGGAAHCIVEGCVAAENGAHGLWLLSGAEHVTVMNNHCHDNRSVGIEVFKDCEACVVAYNRVARNTLGIHCFTVRRSLLLGNVLERNRSNGIDCNHCNQMRIIGNHSEFNGSPRTEANQVEGCGILLYRTSDSLVLGNVCINNDQGHSLRSGIQLMDEGEDGALCARNVVVGNVCLDDQDKPTQQVAMRIGNPKSRCPDNLVVANGLGRHPQGPFGGNRRGALNAAHNGSGEHEEVHSPMPPRLPRLGQLPPTSEPWHGRVVLVARDQTEVAYLCRRDAGVLRWVEMKL